MASDKPWTKGPGEILRHAFSLLEEDTDTSRRIAMILVDNSIELILKTFIGLPYRITGIRIPRKEIEEAKASFPGLLDAIEKNADSKLDGIDFGEIEWYHRLRNQLYHDGNGLTVERERVEVYAELANILFERLFGERLLDIDEDPNKKLGQFIHYWSILENTILAVADLEAGETKLRGVFDAIQLLLEKNMMSSYQSNKLREIQKLRNKLVHGNIGVSEIPDNTMKQLEELLDWAEEIGKRLC